MWYPELLDIRDRVRASRSIALPVMLSEPVKENKLDPVTSINACFANLDEDLMSFAGKLGVFVSFWDKVGGLRNTFDLRPSADVPP